MLTKPLVVGLLAAGSITAAAGGAYLAMRQNAAERVPAEQAGVPIANPAPGPTAQAPVTETEAVVSPASPTPAEPAVESPAPVAPERTTRRVESAPAPRSTERANRRPTTTAPGEARPDPRPARSEPRRASSDPQPVIPDAPPAAVERAAPMVSEIAPTPPIAPAEREFVEVVLPASSVIGLQVETSLSTERARVEDRVDARVTRDVTADGRIAIPAGSRVIGSVMLVEPGGKIKERARLGVRFHTLVFADGTEVPIRAEPIYREGESPSGESARKIGGAAVGGAILGAILGGGKGAMLGGAAGAAGGTAATMAGGRNPASLPAGTVVTVRLTEPVALDVEKR